MKTQTQRKHRINAYLRSVWLVSVLVLPFCAVFSPASLVADETSSDQGLIDYYVAEARSQLAVADIRKISTPFSAIAIIRQYSIDTNGDTLQIDTALVRLRYNLQRSESDQVPDTLHADTLEILQSSFLATRPETVELFLPAPWERDLKFRLMPDDPTGSGLTIEYSSDSLVEGEVQKSGMFVLDRTESELSYSLTYFEESGVGMRYSRECMFQNHAGFLIPEWIKEFRAEQRVFGSTSFVIEVRVITLRFE